MSAMCLPLVNDQIQKAISCVNLMYRSVSLFLSVDFNENTGYFVTADCFISVSQFPLRRNVLTRSGY